jgi:hypothetical protein
MGYLKHPSTDDWKRKRELCTLGFGKRAKCIAGTNRRLMISTEM